MQLDNNQFRVFTLCIFLMFIFFIILFSSVHQSNLPATDQQLLYAKSECPQIADYLPRTIATQSSLDFYVQKCKDDFVISKQQAVLR